jgi:acetyl esterase/lipase
MYASLSLETIRLINHNTGMKTRMILLILVAGLAITASACTSKPASATLDNRHIQLAYGTHAQQQIEGYLPSRSDGKAPVVLLIHGGGWVSGTRAELLDMAKNLSDDGYAAFSLEYRLAGTAEHFRLADQLSDITAALSLIRSHQGDWGLSPRTALVGGSAGGHLSLMYAYTHQGIDLVVDFYGPTDFTIPWFREGQLDYVVRQMIGSGYDQDPSLWLAASPLYLVKSGLPPTLIIQGQKDEIVPWEQSQALFEALKKVGVPSQLNLDPQGGHGDNLDWPAIMTDMMAWLTQYLKR